MNNSNLGTVNVGGLMYVNQLDSHRNPGDPNYTLETFPFARPIYPIEVRQEIIDIYNAARVYYYSLSKQIEAIDSEMHNYPSYAWNDSVGLSPAQQLFRDRFKVLDDTYVKLVSDYQNGYYSTPLPKYSYYPLTAPNIVSQINLSIQTDQAEAIFLKFLQIYYTNSVLKSENLS